MHGLKLFKCHSFLILSLLVFLTVTTVNSHCSDYNTIIRPLLDLNVHVEGLNTNDTYICPLERQNHPKCTTKLVVKSSYLKHKAITWDDVLLLMIVKPSNIRTTVINWWMQFLAVSYGYSGKTMINLILIADACPNGDDNCNDSANTFMDSLHSAHPSLLKVHMVRAQRDVDKGYDRLACKLMTGCAQIYQKFPHYKYYFKIDDDTVLFPSRLLRFINSLHVAALANTPLYFGSVVNSHPRIPLLCSEIGYEIDTNNSAIGHVTYPIGKTSPKGFAICYAQGGAGYGLNNIAMRILSNTTLPVCTKDMDLESTSEDTYVGYKLYRDLRVQVTHCSGFRATTLLSKDYMANAITFHHVSDNWLQDRNVSLMMKQYNNMF